MRNYSNSTVLVTGASGYIGSALVSRLFDMGAQIICLSRQEMRAPSGIEVVQGDPRRAETWSGRLLDADLVFHLAGETSTYAALADPLGCFEANVLPLVHMGQAFRRSGRVPVIVMASSCSVFGIQEKLPVGDDATPFPMTYYDTYKRMAEMQLAQDHGEGLIRGCALRLANVYGRGPTSQGSPDRGILDRMVRKALAGEALTLYGDGAPLRDYVHLDDVVAAFLAAGSSPEAWAGQAMMVASGEGHSLAQAFGLVADRAAVALGRAPLPLASVPWPASAHAVEFRNFVGNPTRLRDAAAWRAKMSLTEGIDRTISAILGEEA